MDGWVVYLPEGGGCDVFGRDGHPLVSQGEGGWVGGWVGGRVYLLQGSSGDVFSGYGHPLVSWGKHALEEGSFSVGGWVGG